MKKMTEHEFIQLHVLENFLK